MRNRRTLPSRQRTYIRLHVRVDRLEDAVSHFYNVINELRRRVSTQEKKLEPPNGGDGGRKNHLNFRRRTAHTSFAEVGS